MKQKICCLLLILLHLLPTNADGKEPIAFVARVESDALAEEAILLLHCLAARSDTTWEFSGEVRGNHWLQVSEKSGALLGNYHRGKSSKAFPLRAGGSDEACDLLEPAANPGEKTFETEPQPSPALNKPELEVQAQPASHAWLWLGAAAVAVAGFFYWKSKQPAYRGIEMKN